MGSRRGLDDNGLQPLDLDANGIGDAWEERFWGGGHPPLDPADDGDGDGMSNAEEYVANTSPVDRDDRLRLRIASAAPGSPPGQVRWNAAGGRRYILMRALDWPATVWEPVEFIPPAEAGPRIWTDPAAPDGGRCFYRLDVERP
jgi:hypothetical protein